MKWAQIVLISPKTKITLIISSHHKKSKERSLTSLKEDLLEYSSSITRAKVLDLLAVNKKMSKSSYTAMISLRQTLTSKY